MTTLSIPKMGESVSEAQIIRWLKNEGDIIQRDEIYIEVSTDKVDSEIPSPYACILKKIIKKEGETVSVGEPIAEIETINKTDNSTILKEVKRIQDNEKPIITLEDKIQKHQRSSSKLKLSPLVKKILAKNQIPFEELENMSGSGTEGRMTKMDIDSYIKNRAHYIENNTVISLTPSKELVTNKENSFLQEAPLESGDQKVEFDRMRSMIAQYMLQSREKSAHCTTFIEVDVTDLVQWRDQNKDWFLEKYKTKMTYTHLFMYLAIDALKAFPKINAHSTQNGYILKKSINLGFAAALPDGNLIVPNVKGIDQLGFQELVERVNLLATAAKTNKLKPDDIQNGTFTMSNTGIFGSLMGTPIINQPQLAIMSLGEIIKTPSVIEKGGLDVIEVRKKMILSLSYDHRIIDGAYASGFLSRIRQNIESFDMKALNIS